MNIQTCSLFPSCSFQKEVIGGPDPSVYHCLIFYSALSWRFKVFIRIHNNNNFKFHTKWGSVVIFRKPGSQHTAWFISWLQGWAWVFLSLQLPESSISRGDQHIFHIQSPFIFETASSHPQLWLQSGVLNKDEATFSFFSHGNNLILATLANIQTPCPKQLWLRSSSLRVFLLLKVFVLLSHPAIFSVSIFKTSFLLFYATDVSGTDGNMKPWFYRVVFGHKFSDWVNIREIMVFNIKFFLWIAEW